jgi:hypothetical protein
MNTECPICHYALNEHDLVILQRNTVTNETRTIHLFCGLAVEQYAETY